MAKQTWNVDTAHSSIEFTVRHMMFAKVRGRFSDWEASVDLDPAAPHTAQASATIQTASVDTGNADRDEHLRSADFFDVDNHPTMTFVSREVSAEDGELTVTGDLTIRGETRPVTLDVEITGEGVDPWGNRRVGLRATAELDRTDWGLTWNQALEAGGVLVGKTVQVDIELQAVAAEAEAVAE